MYCTTVQCIVYTAQELTFPKGQFNSGGVTEGGWITEVDRYGVEGAAWLIACDPKDDEGLRTAIKDLLEHVPEEARTKGKAAAVEIRKLF